MAFILNLFVAAVDDTMRALRGKFAAEMGHVDEQLSVYLRSFEAPISHYDIIRYHLGLSEGFSEVGSSRGKRLRAILCLLIGRSLNAPREILTTLMLASEMLHSASLVHDDIQDAEPERWGRPTVWVEYGLAQAINAGDAMVAMSFELLLRLTEAGVPAPLVLVAADRYAKAFLRMTEGQHLDLLGGRITVSRDEYLDMIERKTAAPIECFSAVTALVAGGTSKLVDGYARFGRAFGMLYQVCDDIRAIWGDPLDTGKKSKRDIQLRKASLPLVVGLERPSLRLKRLMDAPDDDSPPLTIDEATEVADELLNSNVLARCREIADGYRDEALEHLRSSTNEGTVRQTLEAMVRLCAQTAGCTAE